MWLANAEGKNGKHHFQRFVLQTQDAHITLFKKTSIELIIPLIKLN